MSDHELEAWLNDTPTTAEQYQQLQAAWATIEARYPVPADGTPEDVADDRREAFTAAAEVILGDTTPEQHVDVWKAAQTAVVAAHPAMTGAIVAAVQAGMSEVAAAERFGITRMTVRKALAR